MASSTSSLDTILAKDTILRIVDDAVALGVKSIGWGGDPLLHPDWSKIVEHTAENGINSLIQTSRLVSKKDAKKISQFRDIVDGIGAYIDTINQEVYNQVYSNPKTLGQKIQGYYNLLEAGFPADKILGLITTTSPVLEIIDWYFDEMRAGSVCLYVFKITGLGEEHCEWEPGLSDLKRALEYQARKLGQHLLKTGSTEGETVLSLYHWDKV